MSVVCCLRVSVAGRSLVQRGPTECGVSDCDLETSIMRFRSTRTSNREEKKTSHNMLQKKKSPISSYKTTEILCGNKMPTR